MNRQGRRVVLLLALALLVVPYFVDVVYLGDLTPTHFAQEFETEDQNCQTTYDIVLLPNANIYDSSPISEVSVSIGTPRNLVGLLPTAKIFLLQYLGSTSLISRPPPSTHLS